MAVNKSIIESVELEDGGELSVYIVGEKASLGMEGKSISSSIWITKEELEKLATAINKALEQ